MNSGIKFTKASFIQNAVFWDVMPCGSSLILATLMTVVIRSSETSALIRAT
jgi:hypothetical protein